MTNSGKGREGVKNVENLADVICTSPLKEIPLDCSMLNGSINPLISKCVRYAVPRHHVICECGTIRFYEPFLVAARRMKELRKSPNFPHYFSSSSGGHHRADADGDGRRGRRGGPAAFLSNHTVGLACK